jgi:DNA invertase Pin-like site-specific DNA recombinase
MGKRPPKSKPRSQQPRKGTAMATKKNHSKAALYLRVSTGEQTTANQERELREAADAKGLEIMHVYRDNGISGAKGRAGRPGLDAALKDATRGKYGVLMAWSVDRLGRSLTDLLATLQELHGAGVDLYLHRQAIDTRTPAGRALFQMLGVFAEFERSMIQDRVKAGMARAQAEGVTFGRPKIDPKKEEQIRELLKQGVGLVSVARKVGCGVSAVQRVQREALSLLQR